MFTLPEQLTIAHVDDCKTSLLEEIQHQDIIELDDSNVQCIDTVGVQLLLATVNYITSQKKQLIWQSQSLVIKESIKQLGFNEAALNQYLSS